MSLLDGVIGTTSMILTRGSCVCLLSGHPQERVKSEMTWMWRILMGEFKETSVHG
jgi:hypothetical protein